MIEINIEPANEIKIVDKLRLYKAVQGGFILPHKFYSSAIKRLDASEVSSHETRLEGLGHFPLPKKDIHWLKEEVIIDSRKTEIPRILLESNIPIFFSKEDEATIYIPPIAETICRYFYQAWSSDVDAESDEFIILIKGFLIINSFVGFKA